MGYDSLTDGFRAYARLEDDIWATDGPLCLGLLEAARGYLADAGVTEPSLEEEAPEWQRFALCVWALALYWYDHRDAVEGESSLPAGLRPLLQQLKLTAAVRRAAAGVEAGT